LLGFREDILEPYIEEAGLKTVDYFFRKGMKRQALVGSYGYDATDDIIYEAAKSFRRKFSLFKTFGYLYHCLRIKDVQEELGKYDENNRFKPLERETILKYKSQIKKLIHERISQDRKLKSKIIQTIKEEYEKSSNQKRT
jgi:hypothetical protein